MRRVQLGVKRAFDVFLSAAVLFLGFPLLVFIAILVRLSSPGPVVFTQERIGKNGRPFRIYKFRSMTVAPVEREGRLWSAAERARITRIGAFLRTYGLDELPQLFNILKGDMSVVGPRPPIPIRANKYTEHQRKAFQMRPGLVSLAIVAGRRSIPMQKRIELNVEYVENWSLWLDMVILLRTIPVILCRTGASEVAAD